MKYLYIDTSSSYLYSGIISNEKLIAEVKKNYGMDLSKYAVNEIEKMFKSANVKPDDINKIFVVSGPGSFTGIRIGMTFAKIYAFMKHIKITSISSLEAMMGSVNSNKVLVPIIDARRGYVYAGVYKNRTQIVKDQYIKLEDLIEYLNNLNEEYLYITNDKKFEFLNIVSYNPDILNIVFNNINKKSVNPHLIEPNYLKLTEAEEKEVIQNDN